MFGSLRPFLVVPIVALAVNASLPNTSVSAHAPGSTFSGSGTATIDGLLGMGEWSTAAHADFQMNLPDGGTTPATLYVMNDATNLYIGVRIPGPQIGRGGISLEFDNDHDGIRENGDNAVGMSADATGAFERSGDHFRFNCGGPFSVAWCAFEDAGIDQNTGRSFGGTTDLAASVRNDGAGTFYEYSIPLNSADDAHDFSLSVGDTVGFTIWATFLGVSPPPPCPLCIAPPTPFAHTFFPGNVGFTGEWGDIVIASPDSTPPSVSAVVAPAANPGGWNNSDVTVSWNVVDPDSGIASANGCGESALTDETAGVTLTCSAQNGAGLSATQSVLIKIDKTAPSVAFTGNAGSYAVDQTILITCEATDSLSGLANASCPNVDSRPATDYVGSTATTSTTLPATATDNAGNSATASTTFSVTVTPDGICRLSASLARSEAICAQTKAIADAPNGSAKAGAVRAFDALLSSQTGKTVTAEKAALLSRLAHLL